MQTKLHTLVGPHVRGHVLHRVQWLSIGGLEILKVGPDHVVGLACGDPLSELAAMVGVELPFCVFVLGAPDLYFHAEDWTVVRPPNGTKDQSIGLVRFYLFLSSPEKISRAEDGQE